MRMSIPEVATHFNRERLMQKIIVGADDLGGALYVTKKIDQSRLDLMFVGNRTTIADQLRVGDIVERMLEDGDLVCVFALRAIVN